MENTSPICQEDAVYFLGNEGLIRLTLADGEKTVLTDTTIENLIGMLDGWIYGFDSGRICRVDGKSGQSELVLDVSAIASGYCITAANISAEGLYLAFEDDGADFIRRAARIYHTAPDGANPKNIFVAEGSEHTLVSLCHYDGDCLMAVFQAGEGRCVYKLKNDGTIISSDRRSNPNMSLQTGNSATNLCNDAFLYYGDETDIYFMTAKAATLLNHFSQENLVYYYGQDTRSICLYHKNGTEKLMEDVDCSYLCVTPDWLYYVLDTSDGSTLYRAENFPENLTIGEGQVLAENIAGNNRIIIQDGFLYYWVETEGLYRMGLDGRNPSLLYDLEDGTLCSNWRSISIRNNAFCFFSDGNLSFVNLEKGTLSRWITGEKHFAGGTIVCAAAGEEGVCFAVTYPQSDAPDQIWAVSYTSAQPILLHTLPQGETAVLVNTTDNYGYVKVQDTENGKVYRFTGSSDDELFLSNTYKG